MILTNLKPQPTDIRVSLPGLQIDYYVQFSPFWKNQNIGVIPGHTYQVVERQQVYTPREFITPQLGSAPQDYIDIDLSNTTSSTQNLFPATNNSLNQIFVGMKPFEGFITIFSPQNQPIYQMDATNQIYNIASTPNRYIGSIFPQQSPADDPRVILYAVYNQAPIYIRVQVETPTYDKAVLVFWVNRLTLVDTVDQGLTPAQMQQAEDRALYIPSLQEVNMTVQVSQITAKGNPTQAVTANRLPGRFGR